MEHRHIVHGDITHINQPISMALIRADTDRVTLSGEHYTHTNYECASTIIIVKRL